MPPGSHCAKETHLQPRHWAGPLHNHETPDGSPRGFCSSITSLWTGQLSHSHSFWTVQPEKTRHWMLYANIKELAAIPALCRSDHNLVYLPTYLPLVKRQPATLSTVREWVKHDCLETTDWDVLSELHGEDIDFLTDCFDNTTHHPYIAFPITSHVSPKTSKPSWMRRKHSGQVAGRQPRRYKGACLWSYWLWSSSSPMANLWPPPSVLPQNVALHPTTLLLPPCHLIELPLPLLLPMMTMMPWDRPSPSLLTKCGENYTDQTPSC